MDGIARLTDELFSEAVYSKEVNGAKARTARALEAEYDALVKSGKTSIEAMGRVMSEYGTLE